MCVITVFTGRKNEGWNWTSHTQILKTDKQLECTMGESIHFGNKFYINIHKHVNY